MSIHEKYMQRCLDLAELGAGEVAPNPMVGSVIVHNDKIIGEGYHRKFGKAHAEVNAINKVNDENLLRDSTLYVTLEPCLHFGKTPPCAQLIIDKKIPKVIVGMIDPNEKVAGNGIKILREAGVEVHVGVLNEECIYLNKRFINFHLYKKPYVILKWAQTLDGFIDVDRDIQDAQPTWVTGDLSLRLVHKYRAIEDAILVGTNTVLKDNPTLSTRNWYGKNPVRIVIDRKLKLSQQNNIFNSDAKTIVVNEIKDEITDNVDYLLFDFKTEKLEALLYQLFKRNIQSIIVEGGTKTIQSFIDDNLWNEAQIYIGDKMFSSGVKAPQLSQKNIKFREQLENDRLIVLNNDRKTL